MPRKSKPSDPANSAKDPQDKPDDAGQRIQPRKRSAKFREIDSPKLTVIRGGKGRTGPDEANESFEGKETDSEAHGDGNAPDDAFEQSFHALRGETVEGFCRVLAIYATAFQSSDPVTRELLYQLSIVHFDLKRTENAMHRLSRIAYEAKPEAWLKLHSGFVTQRNALQLASQRLMSELERLQLGDEDADDDQGNRNAEGKLLRDSEGNRIEEYRFWNLYKYSEKPDDKINEAMEVVCYTDGTARVAQNVPLKEFMNGEFMKAEYGLGDQFRRMMRQYKRPLHHPYDPTRMK